jgi:Thioredoxin-like
MKRTQGSWPRRLALVACAVSLMAVAADARPPKGDDVNAAAADDAVVPVTLPEGIALAQQTTTPLFVMLTRATCGNCNNLKGRIAAEQGVKDLLKKYVVVDVDVDGPLARQWQQRFPSPGQTLPFVYVVAANGTGIRATSGVLQGEDLPKMLEEGLTKAEEIHQAAGLVRKSKKKRVAPKPNEGAVAASDADAKDAGVKDDEPAATSDETGSSDAKADKAEKAKTKPPRKPAKVDPLKQAASSLALARSFAEKRPEKAKKYAEQVIQLAPGTPLAADAKKLLESLR